MADTQLVSVRKVGRRASELGEPQIAERAGHVSPDVDLHARHRSLVLCVVPGSRWWRNLGRIDPGSFIAAGIMPRGVTTSAGGFVTVGELQGPPGFITHGCEHLQ